MRNQILGLFFGYFMEFFGFSGKIVVFVPLKGKRCMVEFSFGGGKEVLLGRICPFNKKRVVVGGVFFDSGRSEEEKITERRRAYKQQYVSMKTRETFVHHNCLDERCCPFEFLWCVENFCRIFIWVKVFLT
jgi:hypothetical protein